MKHLLFSFLLCAACASDYKTLTAIETDKSCIEKISPPPLVKGWFDASVDVLDKHISGLLLVKPMDDRSTRLVFTNEAGVKFFDFEFDSLNAFRVHHLIPQLDKKAVVKLLRRDFELLLGLPFHKTTQRSWRMGQEFYHGVHAKDLNHYYITDSVCSSLLRVESGSGRKRLSTLRRFGPDASKPDSLVLQHHTFNMAMRLKSIERE